MSSPEGHPKTRVRSPKAVMQHRLRFQSKRLTVLTRPTLWTRAVQSSSGGFVRQLLITF